jgi:hypothetical protein
MEKYKNTVLTAIVLSEASHIFCCVLPTVFSIVSLLSGIGIISALPLGWVHIHDMLHHYEVPMIALSGLVLALGWGLHWSTEHMMTDQTETHTHCCHGPCEPKKNKVHFVLKAATVLFVVNVSIYFIFHRELGIMPVHS